MTELRILTGAQACSKSSYVFILTNSHFNHLSVFCHEFAGVKLRLGVYLHLLCSISPILILFQHLAALACVHATHSSLLYATSIIPKVALESHGSYWQAVCGNVLHFYDAFYMDPCIHLAIEHMDKGRYLGSASACQLK